MTACLRHAQARIEARAAKLAREAPAPAPPARGRARAIVHIDMDCFFASVAGARGRGAMHDRLHNPNVRAGDPAARCLGAGGPAARGRAPGLRCHALGGARGRPAACKPGEPCQLQAPTSLSGGHGWLPSDTCSQDRRPGQRLSERAGCAVLDNPELAGKPIAISHSASARGAGEVSSASYEARALGVRAGMFMEAAKALCPGLVVMPYEFEKYEAISEQARPPDPPCVRCM